MVKAIYKKRPRGTSDSFPGHFYDLSEPCPAKLVLILVVFNFCKLHSTNFQRQTEQSDESVSVVVVIHITGCEGSKGLIVKAVWRSCTILDDVSFVKFEFNFTGYIFPRSSQSSTVLAARTVSVSLIS